ncbi:oxidoreductase-like domain-containing protein [Rhodoferax saidenbachensis]|uniref:Oxidoreductase n=1 Tax=Rhodoferax saidenbachensis TaxID=1484693 RepID=A0A1P8KCG3_9BURK|nr:oxidoreductase-like domain-containing protein [Rhodoferax saidenbachensis]APW43628.1 oxidoreductase [Rhodoferax saidenbachensis]
MSTQTTPFLQPTTDRASAQARCSALCAQAAQYGLALRAPPLEPTTCCGRGCNGCVWESYYDALVYWREDALAALASVNT